MNGYIQTKAIRQNQNSCIKLHTINKINLKTHKIITNNNNNMHIQIINSKLLI